MNSDDPLREPLSRLRVPEPNPAARNRALHHALGALTAARPTESVPIRPWTACFPAPRWALAGAVAALALLAALGVALGLRRPSAERPSAPAAERVVLSQMEALFGSRLDAVIEHPDGPPDIHLSAAASAAPPSLAQPVLIQFHRAGSAATRVLSYSGREVCITLAGRRTCFESLVTGRGEVILNGERFCWHSDEPTSELDGYRIAARLLPPS